MRNLQSLKLICPCENGGFFSLITFIFSPNSLIFSNVIICCSHSLLWFYPLWSLLLYIYILSFKNFQQFFSVYISAEIFHLSSDFSNINVRPSNILQTSEVLFILTFFSWLFRLATSYGFIFKFTDTFLFHLYSFIEPSLWTFLDTLILVLEFSFFLFFSLSLLFVFLVGSISLLQTFIFFIHFRYIYLYLIEHSLKTL